MALTDHDWELFLSAPSSASTNRAILCSTRRPRTLYQILQGSVRVELQMKDQSTAVVVPAIAAQARCLVRRPCSRCRNVTVVRLRSATLVCVEGKFLEGLFSKEPSLPGRFFAFLASYQAQRLRSSPYQ